MIELPETAALVVVVLIVIVLFRIVALEKRMAALSLLDGKLNALLKHAGIDYDPYGNLPEQVVHAIQQGRKIEAIKHYREWSGAGLKEAKEFVEEVQRRTGPDRYWRS